LLAFDLCLYRNAKISKPNGEVISANDPRHPAPERLGLFGSVAILLKSGYECQDKNAASGALAKSNLPRQGL
jgi:hypothetical protein